MAAPLWPLTVNSTILADGYIPDKQSNIITSENEAGPREQQRQYSAVSTLHPITLKLSRTEYKTLVIFVEETLRGGSLNFQFPLPNFLLFDTDTEATIYKEGRFYVKNRENPVKIKNFFGDDVFVSFTFEELP